MSSVLLVTPDPSTARLAEGGLASVGHEVVTVKGCDAAMRSLFNVSVDVVVLDGALGDDEVKEFRGWLRSSNGSYAVVLLTAASARWLDGSLAGDDERDEIVIKPFEGEGIRKAVEKALNATESEGAEVLMIGGAALDKASHELRGEGTSAQLTPTEFRLMHYLVQQRGSIVSSEELLEKVWEFYPGTGSSELVRSHVRNLRGKLRLVTGDTELLQTVPRRGYRLV